MKKRKQKYDFGKHSLRIVQFYFPKVTKVVDASEAAIVEVTKEDVAKSKVRDHRTCALAIACARIFKATGVLIGLTTSYIIHGDTAYRYHNSGTISREITSFDRKAGFYLGYYKLSPAGPSQRLDAYKTPGPSGPKNGNGKGLRKFRHFTSGVRTNLRSVPDIS